ncbi:MULTISPECIES: alanine racemase [Auritidibacter]|uniref:alanine racemase n=1 Tax=Auritidibacter TaxID=1160973 RepID=UPI000D725432|nr:MULTISPECIES: alanine racemase [Auritidibacter]AXR73039.1 alanine racemase [Auritidibacter sp. NML130574]NIH71464.1 alanine racemase [Auritidibacter ignavus]PXA80914.1 alanine racemase [Auritidibacter sp. NML120636]RMX22837.1 alanine racemase [Auritidibacter ignavus]WGH81580.1 alanine racemase [Auritidibacter ignavus]
MSSAEFIPEAPDGHRIAVINHANLAHNIRVIKDWVAPAQLMAVVKADAYGHGLIPVARTVLEAGASWLGVVLVEEALQLRAAGITSPTLAWLHAPGTDFAQAVEHNIDLGVSGWELPHIASVAEQMGTPAKIHLKIDTGLGRNGCVPEQWEDLVKTAARYQQQGLIRTVGVFSHLAVADEPEREEDVDEQLRVFHWAVERARTHGLTIDLRNIANSPAILSRPDTHLDLVRAGVAIYGLSPFADRCAEDLGLRPVMSLRTRVANNKPVPKGQGVSYGYLYHTSAPTRLALIPLGYADGIPRIAREAPVWIDGTIYRSCGRVAMDQFVVDLHISPEDTVTAPVGAEVELFGERSGLSAAHWAQSAGTINYEIVSRISQRVPRQHIYPHVSEGIDG